MIDGCNAKDPAVKEWTRAHECFHDKLNAELECISDKVRNLNKWLYILIGALAVILYLLGVNPSLLFKAFGK